jgi:hypothetical protein
MVENKLILSFLICLEEKVCIAIFGHQAILLMDSSLSSSFPLLLDLL